LIQNSLSTKTKEGLYIVLWYYNPEWDVKKESVKISIECNSPPFKNISIIRSFRIEGCLEFRILKDIVLPLTKSSTGALGIFAFTQAWIAFMWPLLMANTKELFNLELGLTMFQFKFSTNYGLLMAGSVISVLPMLIVFVFLENKLLKALPQAVLNFSV